MKFTLKNRPTCTDLSIEKRDQLIRWFEGFEKELREKKAFLDIDLESHDVCCVQCLMKGEYMKIKEILGDVT